MSSVRWGGRQEVAVIPGGTAVDDDQRRPCPVAEAAYEQLDAVDRHDGTATVDLTERERAHGRILPETATGDRLRSDTVASESRQKQCAESRWS
jgi:hypothetical protein